MSSLAGNSTFGDMPGPIDLVHYALPPRSLVDSLFSDAASAEKSSLITKLRAQRKKGRAALKQHSENLEKLCEEVSYSIADPAHLLRLAEVVLRNERAAAEQLRPRLEMFQEKLATQGHKLDPELRQLFQENLEIPLGWLELYETLRKRLLAFASDEKPASESILRARPVTGDINYAELSREHIARYPKIRAALAK